MKKIILYTATVCLGYLSLTSCSDVIDIYPVENNTADQFYENEVEVNQAVMGVYARLGRNGTNTDYPTDFYYQVSEGRSDNLYLATTPNAQRDQTDIRLFLTSDVTGLNQTNYARLYQLIKDANYVLLRSDEEEYKTYHAEVRFLRALAYFDLVRTYGPQPIVKTPPTAQEAKAMGRESIEDVYAFIIEDLKFAIANLQDGYYTKEVGRVGSIAAQCLLGYVYVTMAGYPLNDTSVYGLAESALAPVMDVVKARFAPDYSYLFSIDSEHENKYDLFSIQFLSGNTGQGSSLPGYITTSGSSGTSFPEWAFANYTQQGQDLRADTLLTNQMRQEGDLRYDVTIDEGFYTVVNHGDSAKYWQERRIITKFLVKDPTDNMIKSWNDYPMNFPILRPADAYLLYAEALVANNKADKAKEWVDAIRVRAGLNPLTTDPTIQVIMDERRREFLGEGKRYFDLVRMGEDTFVNTLKTFADYYNHKTGYGGIDPTKRDMLMPIPQTVMNTNLGWNQNYGY